MGARVLYSPDFNTGRNAILTVESFTAEMKALNVRAIAEGWSKAQVEMAMNQIISKYWVILPKSIRQQATDSIIRMAQSDYFILTKNLETLNKNLLNNFSPEAIKALVADNPAVIITKESIRGMDIVEAKGNPYIDNYYKQVKMQMRAIAANPPQVAEVIDKRPRKLSLRNLAEMKTRYEAGQEDVAKLKQEDVKLVWTSSHADASSRCEPYQGKLYSLDGTSGRTADGIPYSPLEEAERGPKGDGNGIITGYNCRHFLIEYTPGSNAPSQFKEKNVERERNITSVQRYKETNIRHSKMNLTLARASGDKQEAKRLENLIARQKEDYRAYSLEHGRPVYEWRTQISKDEQELGSYVED